MQRIEKELQQKELRQEMKLRLARLQHNQGLNKPQIIIIGGGGGGGSGSGGIGGSTVQTTATTATTTMMMTPSPVSGLEAISGGISSSSSLVGGASLNNNGAFGVSGMGVGGGGGGVQPQQQHQQPQPQASVPLYGQYGQHNHHHHHHGGSSSGGGPGGGGGAISYLGNAAGHHTHHHVAFMVDPLMHQHVVLSKNSNATAHTPSPLTPNSTDELLPSVDEAQEFSPPQSVHGADDGAYIGPCLSSEALLE